MLHRSKSGLLACVIVCCVFAVSLSFAQVSNEEGAPDEEAAKLRHQRRPEKNLAQRIIMVPTAIVRSPFYFAGKGIKITAIYIDEIALIPRVRAILTSDDGLVALYPTASLGGRSGLGGELKFFNKRFLKNGNNLSFQAAYSLSRHQDHYIRYRVPELFGLVSLDTRFGYNVNTNEDFFGIGNETDADDRTNFRHEKLGGGLIAGLEWTDWLGTRFHINYTDHNLKDGDGTYKSSLEAFDLDTTPGLDAANLLGFGGIISIDTRDNDFYPSRGELVKFSATMFDQTDGEDYGFMRYTLELSNHLTLFRPGRILALRLFGEINTRLSDEKTTPFFERADLGGATDLRGYSVGRFRDKDMVVLNIEYRYSIWEAYRDSRGAVDAVVFMDIGRVFNDLAEDTFKDYKTSYGVGIRSRTIDNFLFRAEAAWSKEEVNIIFKFEPMF